jgi:trehalose synthase
MIDAYTGIAPKGDLILLKRMGERLQGRTFLHVNSTKVGGGVAEILQRMVPMLQGLGIHTRWEVIEGDELFFETTKSFHNALQGDPVDIAPDQWDHHRRVNQANAERLDLEADMVLIHDPQPVPLVEFRKSGHWVWRCHIDLSRPYPEVWRSLRRYVQDYEGAIFSVAKFAQDLTRDTFIIPPSIDPLSEKNRDLSDEEIERVLTELDIPRDRPLVLQVSRFDRFKDPLGVIRAYRMAKKYNDCLLILAGSAATDDPEGEQVLAEVRNYCQGDPDIILLLLPAGSDLMINALQRAATVILQKSLKEGFGLTVSEAMWKGKPIIGGAVGGIPLQIVHGVTGFLVHSIEGAAFRIRQLLNNPAMVEQVGRQAREYVRKNFLITRQMRDYLAVWLALENSGRFRLEL